MRNEEARDEATPETPVPAGSTASGPMQVVTPDAATPVVALVGSPNVGKSVMFNRLTGRYVTVSNYPGTTVEVSRGGGRLGDRRVEVVDTPGLYGLMPLSDEEGVARRILVDEDPDAVIHLVDAKNLDRMLPLTLQLLELGLPVLVVLNMMDEADRAGMKIDAARLSSWLGVPVLPATATTGDGVDAVVQAAGQLAASTRQGEPLRFSYDADIEEAVAEVEKVLPASFRRGARGIALLLLQRDAELLDALRAVSAKAAARVEELADRLAGEGDRDLTYRLARLRHDLCKAEIERSVEVPATRRRTVADRVHDLMVQPWTGVPILLLVLYFGLYQFVGVFGAGTVVDFLESDIFGAVVNPWVDGLMHRLLPGDGSFAYWTRELIGGDYGIVTLGITYAFAIVLPIVFLFFLVFSVLEDSGYFPRLAMLVDRLFKRIGLNGRAVIPVVLGFACDTMATMVTRIQETKRERIITTLLLALAIPCSAQYGVMIAILAGVGGAFLGVSWPFLVWGGVVALSFLATGYLASKVLPGEEPGFYMELPPIRRPRLLNVAVKVLARMKWYFFEILPIFVVASVLIWIGRLTGIFGVLTKGLEPVVGLLGLPPQTSEIFLYGFFRRDFGAAGLYQLSDAGLLNPAQLVVSAVTLTLFLPCVAQLLIMHKERGPKATAIMVGIVLATAFVVGAVLNLVLGWAGVGA